MLDALSTAIIVGEAKVPPEFRPPHVRRKPPVFVNFVILSDMEAVSLTYTDPDESTATPYGLKNFPPVVPRLPNEPTYVSLILKISTRCFHRSTTYTKPVSFKLSPSGVCNGAFPDLFQPHEAEKVP